jgi:hypothetical protein
MLDALQMLILFVGTLEYLETKRFLLIVLCSGALLIIIILIVFSMNVL